MPDTDKTLRDLEKSLKDLGIELKSFSVTDSTNNEAKKYSINASDHHPVLFLAEEQSGGRGRLGRSFSSRKGGIYMSLLFFTDLKLSDIVSVTTAAAVAVAASIESVTGNGMKIKWVNDIYSSEGKVSGILTESVSSNGRSAIIVGIGINVGKPDFPEDLKSIAASVGEIGDKKNGLIVNIASKLIAFFSSPHDRSYMAEYRKRAMFLGEQVDLFSAGELTFSGKMLNIDDDGGLIFLPDGKSDSVVIRTGEISVRKK